MTYTSRDKLTVLEVGEDVDKVSFDTLAELLLERPSNMVYCEFSGETVRKPAY
jgi:hypothetical protein